MKIIKIIRSVITSFLFIILIISLVIDYYFIAIRTSTNRVSDLIDRQYVVSNTVGSSNQDLVDYVDQYINYLFYKRSYPTINYNNITNKDLYKQYETLKTYLRLDYNTIDYIRKVNNLIMNNTILFLINVGIFVIILLLWIFNDNIKLSVLLFGIACIISSIITFIINIKMPIKLFSDILLLLILSIFENIKESFYMINYIYIIIGMVIILFVYICKILKKMLHFL